MNEGARMARRKEKRSSYGQLIEIKKKVLFLNPIQMPLPDRLQRLMIASSSELGHTLTVIKAFRIYVPKSNPRNHWLTLLMCQHLNVNKNLSIHFDRINEAATFSSI